MKIEPNEPDTVIEDPSRRQRKVLRKKMKFVGNEDMDVIMFTEIGCKETESLAKNGNKLVIPVRSILTAAAFSVSGNMHKRHKTTTSVVGNALLCFS